MPKATAALSAFDVSRCIRSATVVDPSTLRALSRPATAVNATGTVTMEDDITGKVAASDMAVADVHAEASAGYQPGIHTQGMHSRPLAGPLRRSCYR